MLSVRKCNGKGLKTFSINEVSLFKRNNFKTHMEFHTYLYKQQLTKEKKTKLYTVW